MLWCRWRFPPSAEVSLTYDGCCLNRLLPFPMFSDVKLQGKASDQQRELGVFESERVQSLTTSVTLGESWVSVSLFTLSVQMVVKNLRKRRLEMLAHYSTQREIREFRPGAQNVAHTEQARGLWALPIFIYVFVCLKHNIWKFHIMYPNHTHFQSSQVCPLPL